MICSDTSSMVALLAGEPGSDVEEVARAFRQNNLVLAPMSVAELLSDASLPPSVEAAILRIPSLEITLGYWERAGKLRALLMRRKFRPKIADTLIAQSCLDHQVALITRDRDFAVFQKNAGLRVLLA
jgi:predicted nucleic acid-binding protein